MFDLPSETIDLLTSFRSSANRIQTVEALRHITIDDENLNYRVEQLRKAGLIEACDFSPTYADGNILVTGCPTSFRMTVKGEDYLAMLDQQRKQCSKKRKQKELDDARAEKQNLKNRRYDRHTAIIANIFSVIIGSMLTLLIEHHNEIIVWVKALFSR